MESCGPPAALLTGATYGELETPMRPGDLCILVSDGVTEALGDDVRAVLERMASAAAASRAGAEEVCGELMAAALAGTGPERVPDWQDDRTVVVMAMQNLAVPFTERSQVASPGPRGSD